MIFRIGWGRFRVLVRNHYFMDFGLTFGNRSSTFVVVALCICRYKGPLDTINDYKRVWRRLSILEEAWFHTGGPLWCCLLPLYQNRLVFFANYSDENVFHLKFLIFSCKSTHFHKKRFARELVLKQRWSITCVNCVSRCVGTTLARSALSPKVWIRICFQGGTTRVKLCDTEFIVQ